jgi:hypothetical protein
VNRTAVPPGPAPAHPTPGTSLTMTDPDGRPAEGDAFARPSVLGALTSTDRLGVRSRSGPGKWIAAALVVGGLAVGGIALSKRGGGETPAPAPAAGKIGDPPPVAVEKLAPPVAGEKLTPPVEKVGPPPVPVAAAKPGTLAIAVNVGDATVDVGGQSVKATGGRARVTLPPGDYDLVVSAPGRKSFSKKIAVGEGAAVEEKIRLERGKGGVVRPVVGKGTGTAGAKDSGANGASGATGATGATGTAGAKDSGSGSKDTGTKDPGKKPPGDDDTIW